MSEDQSQAEFDVAAYLNSVLSHEQVEKRWEKFTPAPFPKAVGAEPGENKLFIATGAEFRNMRTSFIPDRKTMRRLAGRPEPLMAVEPELQELCRAYGVGFAKRGR